MVTPVKLFFFSLDFMGSHHLLTALIPSVVNSAAVPFAVIVLMGVEIINEDKMAH